MTTTELRVCGAGGGRCHPLPAVHPYFPRTGPAGAVPRFLRFRPGWRSWYLVPVRRASIGKTTIFFRIPCTCPAVS